MIPITIPKPSSQHTLLDSQSSHSSISESYGPLHPLSPSTVTTHFHNYHRQNYNPQIILDGIALLTDNQLIQFKKLSSQILKHSYHLLYGSVMTSEREDSKQNRDIATIVELFSQLNKWTLISSYELHKYETQSVIRLQQETLYYLYSASQIQRGADFTTQSMFA